METGGGSFDGGLVPDLPASLLHCLKGRDSGSGYSHAVHTGVRKDPLIPDEMGDVILNNV